jgi:hypothetical protein
MASSTHPTRAAGRPHCYEPGDPLRSRLRTVGWTHPGSPRSARLEIGAVEAGSGTLGSHPGAVRACPWPPGRNERAAWSRSGPRRPPGQSMPQDDPGGVTTRTDDLLRITKALLVQPTRPNSARMLIRHHRRGGACPSECPSVGGSSSVQSSNYISDLCGAMGIRTPDLLHAMNHSPVPRPGHMRPDQARHQLTLAAAGSAEPSLVSFCPSICP